MADPRTSSDQHHAYMRLALNLAQKSPPKPTNFRVGAVLVDAKADSVLSTGYTLELPGNTHAEQCCFCKYAESSGVSEEEVGRALPEDTVLYTTMEPCAKRQSGNLPCLDRILRTRTGEGKGKGGIRKVYVGVREPKTFVGDNLASTRLEEHGIEYAIVPGFEDEILEVATAGHGGKQ